MPHYVCTVEFRDPDSGAVHHFVRELSAPDGDTASEEITRSFMDEHSNDRTGVEIAEVVCRPEGNH